ncbi:MAG: hypothetical protein RL095_1301 [Verrucomicrobiota bacterium]|jgi:Na+/H+ antiporter NhaD/arsenite permease-like protein
MLANLLPLLANSGASDPLTAKAWLCLGIFALLYVCLTTEIIERSLAAIFGAAAVIASGCIDIKAALACVDLNVLFLLVGMMTSVAILAETGFIEWIAVSAAKKLKGDGVKIVIALLTINMLLSCFLPNVTVVIMIIPVTVLIAQILELPMVPLIVFSAMASNIGGVATYIGDPPNAILGSYLGMGFMPFIYHMTPIAFVIAALFIGVVVLSLRSKLQVPERIRVRILDSHPELAIRNRKKMNICLGVFAAMLVAFIVQTPIADATAKRVGVLVHDEARAKIAKEAGAAAILTEDNFSAEIDSFAARKGKDYDVLVATELFMASIQNQPELMERCAKLGISEKAGTIIANPDQALKDAGAGITIPIGIIALSAMALMLLLCREESDKMYKTVEWDAILYYCGLFIVIGALEHNGLILKLADMIMGISHNHLVTCMIILFGSAILSAFLDNTPFIIAMCPLVKHIIGVDYGGDLMHPEAQAMIWSLLLGTCLGGNGSLIGSSANIIAAKIGDKSGAPVSFGAFTKIGFPIMLATVCVAAVYVWLRYFVFGGANGH